MDMQMFQVHSNKIVPMKGNMLISSPFLHDFQFARSVILLVEHSEEGSVGIVMNQNFRTHIFLDDILPHIKSRKRIPIYKGGPVCADTLFYLHSFKKLQGAIPLSDGLYLNGDFDFIKRYIQSDEPLDGVIRFFTGYAGWDKGQLEHEIEDNAWVVSPIGKRALLEPQSRMFWKECLNGLGGKYALWATYPLYPVLN